MAFIRALAAALVIAAGLVTPLSTLSAQAAVQEASISGILTDRSGAVLTGADIHIQATGMNRSWTVTTDSHGH